MAQIFLSFVMQLFCYSNPRPVPFTSHYLLSIATTFMLVCIQIERAKNFTTVALKTKKYSDFRSKNIPGPGRYETYFDTRQIIGEKNKYSIPKAPRQVSSNKSRAFLH